MRSISGVIAPGDRPEEAQQRDQLLAATAGEAVEQRGRQTVLIDGRHEDGACDAPERACREGVACRATIKVRLSVNQDETAPCVG